MAATVIGTRDRTDYGFCIEGKKTKSFETKFVTLMEHALTPVWNHEKKTRVYRVAAGEGYLQTFKPSTEEGKAVGELEETKSLTPGCEVAVGPNTIHRLSSGVSGMAVYLTQDAKYEAALKELAPSESVAEVPTEQLSEITDADKAVSDGYIDRATLNAMSPEDRQARRLVRRSQDNRQRLTDQINAARSGRLARPSGTVGPAVQRDASGINVRPQMNFDAEGAG